MSEKIKLYPVPETHIDPRSRRMRTRKVKEINSVGVSAIPNSGGIEPKMLHEIKIGKKDNKSLVARHVSTLRMDSYMNTWKVFREAGMPVVKSMWKSGDRYLFVKNLKHDGSEIFGKAYKEVARIDFRKERRPLTSMEKIFVKIMESDLPKIEEAVSDMVKKADEHKLVLPDDDPFELLVHPDGTWEIIILDLKMAKEGNMAKEGQESGWNSNDVLAQKRLTLLEDLKDFLKEQEPELSLL